MHKNSSEGCFKSADILFTLHYVNVSMDTQSEEEVVILGFISQYTRNVNERFG